MDNLTTSLTLTTTTGGICATELESTFSPPREVWTALPIVSLVALSLGVPTNSYLVFVVLHEAELRTAPLNVYLGNIFAANALALLLTVPLHLVNQTRGGGGLGWTSGPAACTVWLYSAVLRAGLCCLHLLITGSQVWAVCRPNCYRRRHSATMAAGLCAGMWVYVHVFKVRIKTTVAPITYSNAICFIKKTF